MAYLKCRFYLKNPQQKFSSVFLNINHKPFKPFKFPLVAPSMGKVVIIPTECWDNDTQKPKRNVPIKYQTYKSSIQLIGILIKDIISNVEAIKVNAELNKIEINNTYLRNELNNKLEVKDKMNKKLSVVEFQESIISEMENGTLLKPKTTNRYNDKTIGHYKTTCKSIWAFDILRGRTTFFEDINNDWYDEYINFLIFEQEIFDDNGKLIYDKIDLKPSTIGSKFIKNLISMMRYANKKGVSNTLEYQKDYFIRPESDAFSIALTEKELKSLYNLKLKDYDDKVRDLFLVGAYTALRFSDFSILKPENFKIDDGTFGFDYIQVITFKNKKDVVIPFLWEELKSICQKYNYNFPSVNSTVFNRKIKEIGRMAGITQIEKYYETKRSETYEVETPRYKLISSHSGRRSAATNLIIRKIPPHMVMKLTGHTKLETLQKYIKLDGIQNASLIFEQFNNGEK